MDLTGVGDVKNVASTSPPIWLTLSLVVCMCIFVGVGGFNYFPLNYSGSNGSGGCEKNLMSVSLPTWFIGLT